MLDLSCGGAKIDSALFLGAHSDDIEIGCGGTIQRLVAARPNARIHWVTLSSDGVRAEETRNAAAKLTSGAKSTDVRTESFAESFFPYRGADIKAYFERLKREMNPDVVFTHYRNDLHQDHRVVNELTWNTFRNHLVLEYEIPKFDGDLGSPNVFVPLSAELAAEKIRLVHASFPSQREKHWFDEALFPGLMRLRGMEAASPSGFAEAFTSRKLSLRVE
jgi:LmbE family N-acetylglucosaminyl deacetylase